LNLGRRQAESAHEKTFCEFFAGIGLVDEGLRPSGWRCIYANDIDERKREMHASRNGPVDYYHLEDVSKTDEIVARIAGNPFLATASFPCIDLSVAGHFKGFEGKHSSTFFAFADVLKKLDDRRPKLIVLENVLGFLSSRKGEDFKAAALALAELGYWIDAFVLDASRFVPQSRPRVFVIGMARDVRPEPTAASLIDEFTAPALEPSVLRPEAITKFMATVDLPTGWLPLNLPHPPQRKIDLEEVIDLGDDQEWWGEAEVQRHYRMMHHYHRRQIDLFIATKTFYVGTIFRRVRKGGQRAEVRFDGLAGCLRTPRGGSGRQIVIVVQDGGLRMRWMSPREYARLQGVPDFPLMLPRNQLLYGFADAVCVPVIRWVDRNALTPLYEAASPSRRNGHAGQSNS
jgi:DNA (cytosine-5)-methyltransferase 1